MMAIDDNLDWFDTLHLERFLGAGSFGLVFSATSEHNDEDEDCAVKFIFFENSDVDPMEKERVTREYNLIAGLRHENLVDIMNSAERNFTVEDIRGLIDKSRASLEFDKLEEIEKYERRAQRNGLLPIFCIKMELCGRTLRDWLDVRSLRRQESNSNLENEQFSIVSGMIQGLKFLHSHIIMHRDFRPDNIMFSEFDTIKIGDFGLCRKWHSAESRYETLSNFVGAALYRAPEADTTNYGLKADLYSLGLVIWEVIQLMPKNERFNNFYNCVHNGQKELIKCHPKFHYFEETVFALTRLENDRIKSINSFSLTDTGQGEWMFHLIGCQITFTIIHPEEMQDVKQLVQTWIPHVFQTARNVEIVPSTVALIPRLSSRCTSCRVSFVLEELCYSKTDIENRLGFTRIRNNNARLNFPRGVENLRFGYDMKIVPLKDLLKNGNNEVTSNTKASLTNLLFSAVTALLIILVLQQIWIVFPDLK